MNYNNEPLIYAETLTKYNAIRPIVDTNVSAAFIKDPRVIKTHNVDFFCLNKSQEDFVRDLNTTINNFKTEINNTIGNIPKYGVAKSNELGLIKVGYTTNGKYYKVDVDTEGNAFVNVPWEAGGGITEITKQMLKSVLEGNDDSSYYLGGDLLWHLVPAQQAGGDTLNAPLKQINEIGAPTSSNVILKYNGTTWVYESISNLGGGGTGDGTITSIIADGGLITADGNPITTSGTIKANLRSYTRLSGKPANAGEEDNKIYPVSLDSEGKLSVNVPWVPAVSGGDAPIFSAALGGPTEDASLAFSGTFVVPYVSQNSAGLVTVSNKTMTLPAAPENIILNEPLSTINSAGLGAPTEAGQVLSWTGSAWNYTIPSGGGNGGSRGVLVNKTQYYDVNDVETDRLDGTSTYLFLNEENQNRLCLSAGPNIFLETTNYGMYGDVNSTNDGILQVTALPREILIHDQSWPNDSLLYPDRNAGPNTHNNRLTAVPLNFLAGEGVKIEDHSNSGTNYIRFSHNLVAGPGISLSNDDSTLATTITCTGATLEVVTGIAETYQATNDDGNPIYGFGVHVSDEDQNKIFSVRFEGNVVSGTYLSVFGQFHKTYTHFNITRENWWNYPVGVDSLNALIKYYILKQI